MKNGSNRGGGRVGGPLDSSAQYCITEIRALLMLKKIINLLCREWKQTQWGDIELSDLGDYYTDHLIF